jgi:flagellar biosynthesis protein FlhF
MLTKTYQADTALETLQLVQAELGANAIVVSMRDVPLGPSWSPWKKSSVEIVAALPESQASQVASQATPTQAPVLRQSENKTGVEFIEEMPEIEWDTEPDGQLAGLRAQPHPKLRLNLNPVTQNPPPASSEAAHPKTKSTSTAEDKYIPPVLKKILGQLIDQGVESKLVDNLVHLALETLSPATLGDGDACRKSIIQLLGAELPVQRGAGRYVSGNVVCVIGGSGGGKTSSVAKLALFYSQTMNKTITWVCADTVRSGAVAEARAYTDALGFNLKLVYTPEDLKGLLLDAGPDDLFLVDTPGYNPCSESQMTELGTLLSELPKRCTYLVAPATIKETDLFQLSASLGVFNLDGVIITKLDETHSFGSVYNFARKNKFPLGYFATGRDAARNLEVADPARLASALFGKEWNK